MANRPAFINTAGQRKHDGTGFEPIDLLPRYVDAYAGRFKWTGLPEGCPDDFPEVKLFEVGGLSAKKVRGLGDCVMGAAPETLTIYGTPMTWLPAGIVGNVPGSSVNEYLFKASNNPVLWEGVPMMERIDPYLRIMCKAMNALQMNTVSLSMPILVETAPGAELAGKMIRTAVGNGDIFIPTVSKGAIAAQVLDLKATDHTANLLGVIHDMDAQMLDMMHIRTALEKASGISDAEATASDQQVSEGLLMDLQRRRTWCDLINDRMGWDLSVELRSEPVRPILAEDEDGDDTDV